jgi:hypothetical protein
MLGRAIRQVATPINGLGNALRICASFAGKHIHYAFLVSYLISDQVTMPLDSVTVFSIYPSTFTVC